jgi:hypothetical protein
MRRLFMVLALAAAAPAPASPWQFEAPIDVSAARAGVFPHLSGAGRRHLAVQDRTVAVVWEDNRSGQPQVYAALRRDHRGPFSRPVQLSGGRSAYEPAVVAVGPAGFVVAWEQDESIQARVVDGRGRQGPVLRLSAQGTQVSLAALNGRVTAVWSEPHGTNRLLKLTVLSATDNQRLEAQPPVLVEANPPAGATPAFPSVAVTRGGTVVAWEDRRNVSSAIYFSQSSDGREFSPPRLLNERQDPPADRRYGSGTTAMRVALSAQGEQGVAAVWLDKRTLGNGFDTYAAFSLDGGIRFGANRKIQDNFANTFAQLNAVVAAKPERIAVAWNDDRDGNQDVWLSWPTGDNRWSENLAVPGASGPGDQTHPAMVIDGEGALHLVWLDLPKADAPARLRYLRARPAGR